MEVRIFCEGEADREFLVGFLNHLKKEGLNIDNPLSFIEVKKTKSKLLDKNSYKFDKLKKIKKALFLVDCDFERDDKRCGGCENSRRCLEELIEEFAKRGIECDYFLFDNNLEAFLLSTVDNNSKICFEDLKSCLELEEKAKHQKALICIYKGLYPKSPFDFSHPNFDELKKKIFWLFKE
jgi:hypothetical protein